MGESPGPSADPANYLPLHPFPPTSAGGRLAAIAGWTPEEYLRRTARANLFGGHEPKIYPNMMDYARECVVPAYEMSATLQDQVIVLLGRNVQRAFGFEIRDLFLRTARDGVQFFLMPHPSGRCRAWNDPENVKIAREFFATVRTI